jgi:hypothetical protein
MQYLIFMLYMGFQKHKECVYLVVKKYKNTDNDEEMELL